MLKLWGRGEMHTEILCTDLRKGEHLEYLGVRGRVILKWTMSVDWIDLAQDTDRWLAVVQAVMNNWIP